MDAFHRPPGDETERSAALRDLDGGEAPQRPTEQRRDAELRAGEDGQELGHGGGGGDVRTLRCTVAVYVASKSRSNTE